MDSYIEQYIQMMELQLKEARVTMDALRADRDYWKNQLLSKDEEDDDEKVNRD